MFLVVYDESIILEDREMGDKLRMWQDFGM